MNYVIYCDGAATMKKVNGEYTRCAGGHAFVVYTGGFKVYEDAKGMEMSTNNEQELMAVRDALLWLKADPKFDGFSEATICSDSAYCVNIFTKWTSGWKKQGWTRGRKHEPIENLELIKEIDELMRGLNIKIEKVKGHGNCAGNIRADELAVKAKKKYE